MPRHCTRWIARSIVCLACATVVLGPARAAFYANKTINVIVPYAAGGGTDTRARVIARFLSRFIPGQPRFDVQNMPGASGVVATNHLFNAAEANGLTLGLATREQVFLQMAQREGVKYDVREFAWIGGLVHDGQVVFIRSDLPYRSLQDLRAAAEPLLFGVRRIGSSDYMGAKALAALGVPLTIVPGYGTRKHILGFEQGEFNASSLSWSSLTQRGWVGPDGLARPIIQLGARIEPGVPSWHDVRAMPGQEAVFALINGALNLPQGGLLAPPRTPQAQVDILRAAYDRMVLDPEFQEAVRKINIEMNPVKGADLAKLYGDFLTASPDTQALFKSLGQ